MIKKLVCVLVLAFCVPLLAAPDPDLLLRDAERALERDSTDYRAWYKRAWAEYTRERYDEAEKDFKKALGYAPPEARADLLYNLGNSYFMQQNMQAAAETWRSGLRLKPDDADMLYNYTVARRLLEREEEKKEGEKDDTSKDSESGEDGKNKEQDQKQEQDQEQNQGQNQEQEQNRRQPGEMSEEEALRLLRALQDQERQESQKEKAIIGGARLEKDW